MPPNRRKHSRIKKRLKVEFGDVDLRHKGILSDISVGGLFVVAGRLFKAGTRLHLHVVETDWDFYAEGVVARLRRVDQLLRRIEAQGMGVRLLSPAEVVRTLIPRVSRTVETKELICASADQLERLLREQLSAGVLLVPVVEPIPAPNTVVEFSIHVDFGASPRSFSGQGRIMQILDQAGTKRAVLEVQDAAQLRAALEAAG